METITKLQVVCIKTLVGKLGADGEAMALGFSNMRTSHVSKLDGREAAAMIKELKGMDSDEVGAEKMRRKMIGMAYARAGLGRSANAAQKRAVVNWLDGWCKKYGYKKKALNSYTYNEMPALVTQFEKVINSLIIGL